MDKQVDSGIEGSESMDTISGTNSAGLMTSVGGAYLQPDTRTTVQLRPGLEKRFELFDVELTSPDDENYSEISLDEILSRNLSPHASDYSDGDFDEHPSHKLNEHPSHKLNEHPSQKLNEHPSQKLNEHPSHKLEHDKENNKVNLVLVNNNKPKPPARCTPLQPKSTVQDIIPPIQTNSISQDTRSPVQPKSIVECTVPPVQPRSTVRCSVTEVHPTLPVQSTLSSSENNCVNSIDELENTTDSDYAEICSVKCANGFEKQFECDNLIEIHSANGNNSRVIEEVSIDKNSADLTQHQKFRDIVTVDSAMPLSWNPLLRGKKKKENINQVSAVNTSDSTEAQDPVKSLEVSSNFSDKKPKRHSPSKGKTDTTKVKLHRHKKPTIDKRDISSPITNQDPLDETLKKTQQKTQVKQSNLGKQLEPCTVNQAPELNTKNSEFEYSRRAETFTVVGISESIQNNKIAAPSEHSQSKPVLIYNTIDIISSTSDKPVASVKDLVSIYNSKSPSTEETSHSVTSTCNTPDSRESRKSKHRDKSLERRVESSTADSGGLESSNTKLKNHFDPTTTCNSVSRSDAQQRNETTERTASSNSGTRSGLDYNSNWTPPDAGYYLKRYENNPKAIDNYEPGRSSVLEKESYVSPFYNPPAEKPGEHCKYTVGGPRVNYSIRRTGHCISPSTPVRRQYLMVQRGEDIPFEGLRGPAPPPRLQSSLSPIDSGLIHQTRTNHRYPPIPAHQQRMVTSSLSGHVTPVKRHSVSADYTTHHQYRPLSPLTGLELELSRQRREAAIAVRKREMERIISQTKDRRIQEEEERNRRRRYSDNFPSSLRSPVALDRYSFDELPAESPRGPQSPVRYRQSNVKVKALYNFTAQLTRELSFRKGDVIYLLRRIDQNWLEGERNGTVGIFPANYVEVIESKESVSNAQLKRGETFSALAKFNFEAFDSSQLSFCKGDVLRIRERIDENWFRAELNGQVGLVPESYLELTKVASSDSLLLNTSSTSFTDSILLGSPGGVSSSGSSVLSSIPDFSIPASTTTANMYSTGKGSTSDQTKANFNSGDEFFYPSKLQFNTLPSDRRCHDDAHNLVEDHLNDSLLLTGFQPSWYSTMSSGYRTSCNTRENEFVDMSHRQSRDDGVTSEARGGRAGLVRARSETRDIRGHEKSRDEMSHSRTYSENIEKRLCDSCCDVRDYSDDTHTDRHMSRDTDRHTSRHMNRDADRHTGRHMNRDTSRQTVRRSESAESVTHRSAERRREERREGGGSASGWVAMPYPGTMCILTPENRYGATDEHLDSHSIPYQAVFDYEPRNADELGLEVGDLIYVTERFDDGWFVGISNRTNSFGMFPGNYVQRLRVRHLDLSQEYQL